MKTTSGRSYRPGLEPLDGREMPALLAPVTSAGGGISPSVADFNHDGRDDLAAISSDQKTVIVRLSKGDGTFRPSIVLTGAKGNGLYSAMASDVNNDGHPDVVAS